MTWCEGNVRTGCYWDFSRLSLRTAISTGDAVEGIAHLHREAVLRTAVTDYPVGAHLSGGLDSSGNCVAIDELLRAGRLPAPAAYALATLFPGFSCNEPEYIKPVAAGLSFETLYFEPEWPSSEEHFARVAFHSEPSPYPHFSSFHSGYRGLKALGGRVVLTGEHADELFLTDPSCAAKLMWKCHLQEARQRLQRIYLVKQEDGFLRLIRRCVALGLPTESPFDWIRRIRAARWQRYSSDAKRFSVGWLTSERLGLRMHASLGVTMSGDPHVDATVGHLFKGYMSHLQEMSDLATAPLGIELRSPFMHKPLVEFCATLPPRLRDDFTSALKWVLRQSMRNRLPDQIVERGEKVDFSDAYGDYIQRLVAAQCMRQPLVSSEGRVAVQEGVTGYTVSQDSEGRVFQPGAMLNVIAWLQDEVRHEQRSKS